MLTSADGLKKNGNDIYFCGQPHSIFLGNAQNNNFETFPLPIKGDFNPVTISRLVSLIKQLKIDIIMANFNKDVRLGGIAKKIAGRGILVARNGLPILQNKLIYRLTYQHLADRILTNSISIKNKYLHYGWLADDFIKVIYNGIDVSLPRQTDTVEKLTEYKIPADSKVVGFFGRFVGQKQPLTFLKAAMNIIRQIPNTRFIMAGDGPLRASVEQEARTNKFSDRLILPGFQNDIFPLLNICDLVLLTSYKEGLPNIVMEAMWAEKAVVAFDAGGVKELIPNDAVGRVVPMNDIYSMSEHSVSLLRNNDERKQLCSAASQFIKKNFSKDRMIAELQEFLSSLL